MLAINYKLFEPVVGFGHSVDDVAWGAANIDKKLLFPLTYTGINGGAAIDFHLKNRSVLITSSDVENIRKVVITGLLSTLRMYDPKKLCVVWIDCDGSYAVSSEHLHALNIHYYNMKKVTRSFLDAELSELVGYSKLLIIRDTTSDIFEDFESYKMTTYLSDIVSRRSNCQVLTIAKNVPVLSIKASDVFSSILLSQGNGLASCFCNYNRDFNGRRFKLDIYPYVSVVLKEYFKQYKWELSTLLTTGDITIYNDMLVAEGQVDCERLVFPLGFWGFAEKEYAVIQYGEGVRNVLVQGYKFSVSGVFVIQTHLLQLMNTFTDESLKIIYISSDDTAISVFKHNDELPKHLICVNDIAEAELSPFVTNTLPTLLDSVDCTVLCVFDGYSKLWLDSIKGLQKIHTNMYSLWYQMSNSEKSPEHYMDSFEVMVQYHADSYIVHSKNDKVSLPIQAFDPIQISEMVNNLLFLQFGSTKTVSEDDKPSDAVTDCSQVHLNKTVIKMIDATKMTTEGAWEALCYLSHYLNCKSVQLDKDIVDSMLADGLVEKDLVNAILRHIDKGDYRL